MDKIAMIPLAVHEMAQERNYRRFACLVIGWAVTVIAFLVANKVKKG
jgi:hypothetical protein